MQREIFTRVAKKGASTGTQQFWAQLKLQLSKQDKLVILRFYNSFIL